MSTPNSGLRQMQLTLSQFVGQEDHLDPNTLRAGNVRLGAEARDVEEHGEPAPQSDARRSGSHALGFDAEAGGGQCNHSEMARESRLRDQELFVMLSKGRLFPSAGQAPSDGQQWRFPHGFVGDLIDNGAAQSFQMIAISGSRHDSE